MKRQDRKAQILKRKNFFPTLVITIVLWILLAALIYFVDPNMFGVIPLFFASLLFTFSLIFANSRRGLIVSISLCLFLILMYLGVGNWLNFVLIAAIAGCIELYFTLK